MVINKIITTQLSKQEQAEDLRNSQELLALTIRNAKDVVNGRARRYLEEKQRKQSRWSITGNESEETVAEVAAS
jgi:hypothetical protein